MTKIDTAVIKAARLSFAAGEVHHGYWPLADIDLCSANVRFGG
jgi:hypothetical protein